MDWLKVTVTGLAAGAALAFAAGLTLVMVRAEAVTTTVFDP
jgi:hypothetical protein